MISFHKIYCKKKHFLSQRKVWCLTSLYFAWDQDFEGTWFPDSPGKSRPGRRNNYGRSLFWSKRSACVRRGNNGGTGEPSSQPASFYSNLHTYICLQPLVNTHLLAAICITSICSNLHNYLFLQQLISTYICLLPLVNFHLNAAIYIISICSNLYTYIYAQQLVYIYLSAATCIHISMCSNLYTYIFL